MDISSQLLQARELIQAKKFEEARPILKQILAEDKRNVNAWILFGDSMSDKRVQLECYKKAITFDPSDKIAIQRYESLKIEFANLDLKTEIKAKNTGDGEKIGLGKALGIAKASAYDLQFPIVTVLIFSAIIAWVIWNNGQRLPYIFLGLIILVCALIGFLAWIIVRLGNEITVWQNGIVHKWYGGNTRIWLWTDFNDVEHKMHKTNYYNRRGQLYKVEKRLFVKLFSEKGNLVIDWRYDNHIPYGNYAIDCQVRQGKPKHSLEAYLRANPMKF